MINDEDLRSRFDYNERQKEAAHRILVELVNLFNGYKEDIRIIGGWVPDLMFPNAGHIGSVDVDVLINHINLRDSGYNTMRKILLRNGYKEHPEKYFSFVKSVQINGVEYDVDVDILAGMYGGTLQKKRSQHVQGIKALKATGGNFAFEFDPQTIKIESKRVDGAIDVVRVNVIAVVPYFVMKTAALGRGKAKDAYDLYFLVKHYRDGVEGLVKLFEDYKALEIVRNMREKLEEKFASPEHAGPADVAAFLDLDDAEEIDQVKRDVYEQFRTLIDGIK